MTYKVSVLLRERLTTEPLNFTVEQPYDLDTVIQSLTENKRFFAFNAVEGIVILPVDAVAAVCAALVDEKEANDEPNSDI